VLPITGVVPCDRFEGGKVDTVLRSFGHIDSAGHEADRYCHRLPCSWVLHQRQETCARQRAILKGKKKDGPRAMVVPSSGLVRRRSRKTWLKSSSTPVSNGTSGGCSMCLAMKTPTNCWPQRTLRGDLNRNFEGRQGRGSPPFVVARHGRRRLQSPAIDRCTG
jgi:3-isopropylmalate/(R)-2-methylmalate dehydratase large subunit